MDFGAVAIGRNEGDRLKRCLASLSQSNNLVYVDSGSADGSVEWAEANGAHVVRLQKTQPFTAGRARNAGVERLLEIAGNSEFVQLIDGDCQLNAGWPIAALQFLASHPSVAAVSGRLHERHPEQSIYNWLCDKEWEASAGETSACGGISMFRISAFRAAGGFREELIAGEEPELCLRLRAAGWKIWRIDADMAVHDADIRRFGQWWRRSMRAGYTYAQGANLHGSTERYMVWESLRAWLWALLLPVVGVAFSLLFYPWGLVVWLLYPAQILRQMSRNTGRLVDRLNLSMFQLLARFAEACGQIKFWKDRAFGKRAALIEYK
jgi:GT2 family glycosyltransferase